MHLTESLLHLFQGIPQELVIFLFSMLPVIELRGALPVALGVYNMSVPLAYLLVVLGNMVPAIAILFGWDAVINWVKQYWPWLHEKLEKIEQKTQGKWDKKIEKYGPWALIVFVAIPLPGSGVWTGALAAWIFNLSKKRAILSLFTGVVLAAILVGGITLGGLKLF